MRFTFCEEARSYVGVLPPKSKPQHTKRGARTFFEVMETCVTHRVGVTGGCIYPNASICLREMCAMGVHQLHLNKAAKRIRESERELRCEVRRQQMRTPYLPLLSPSGAPCPCAASGWDMPWSPLIRGFSFHGVGYRQAPTGGLGAVSLSLH